MDRVEADATPAEEWQADLNAACNRLNRQYLDLLRSASSAAALDELSGRQDPRAGGGVIKQVQEPPPPLAQDAALAHLRTQLAVQNMCAASSQLLDHIRTLRLSVLLMDEDTIAAEEEWQVRQAQKIAQQAQEEGAQLEMELYKAKHIDGKI